jgi:hypothetical protein
MSSPCFMPRVYLLLVGGGPLWAQSDESGRAWSDRFRCN